MTDITEMDFDNYLTKDKGWVKNKSGYEYVYDYRLKQIPSIMIKVLSSVNTGEGKSNKGSHAIRIFAVKVNFKGEIIRGYIKKQVVQKTETWKEDLKSAYLIIRSQVFVRARKQGLI
jgi:hypothetical protein